MKMKSKKILTYKVFGETISTSDIRRTTNRTSLKFRLTFCANEMTVPAAENWTSSWHLSANRTLQLFAQLIDRFFPELFLRIFIRFVGHFFSFLVCRSVAGNWYRWMLIVRHFRIRSRNNCGKISPCHIHSWL